MRQEEQHNRTGSRAKWVFIAFILIAGYFAITEHKAHLSGLLQYLPLLLVLACPLMHIFMHGHHGSHGHSSKRREPPTRNEEPS